MADETQVHLSQEEWARVQADLARLKEKEAKTKVEKEKAFRDFMEAGMHKVLAEVNGHPSTLVEQQNRIEEKLNTVLKIKEEQMPSYVRKLLVGLILALGPVAYAVTAAWWYANKFHIHLPKLIELLEKIK